MRKEFSIYDRNGNVLNIFSILFVKRKTKELKLDAETFYKKYANHIPEETIEMMIDESAPFTFPTLLDAKIHIHQGHDGEQYICYPKQIDTIEEAINIASNWCLITVFHIKEKADVAWFESFGNWMVKLGPTTENKVANSFEQFPLWIQNGFLGWKVETSGKPKL